jgi:exodeoxyribonuclease VII large subunit
MSDLLASDSPTNAAEYTVTEISGALKRTVEDLFGNVRVRGEISGFRGPHSSGHCYFSLKDERSRLEAVIWKGTYGRLRFKPEEGMEVIASGKLTTYPGSSKYQIVIDNIEPAGAGALMALLEERKRKLAAEGLFEEGRKRPLPFMPRVIGVVTSPTGAVIRDIIHRITDRFPLHVVVWPVRVQGETTGAEVSAAVAGFNRLEPFGAVPRPDVIIVARGGGSLEDLWGFNDEAVVRAVAASAIPVISAVGHETDWTLIDLVADRRAPTPTGAAELAVPVKAELEAALAGMGARLSGSVSRTLVRRRDAVRACARALPSPDQLLGIPRRRFDELASRLSRALEVGTERKRMRLAGLRLSTGGILRRIDELRWQGSRDSARAFAALSRCTLARRQELDRASARLRPEPLARANRQGRASLDQLGKRMDMAVKGRLDRARASFGQAERMLSTLKLSEQAILQRGYALVTDVDGQVVRRAGEVSNAQALTLTFADGKVEVVAGAKAAGGKPTRQASSGTPTRQGSLFD